MIAALIAILVFIQQYIITAIFAVGVIFILYGFINSFLLHRADLGHPFLLRSMVLFALALLLYGVTAFFIWFGTVWLQTDSASEQDTTDTENSRPRSLPTPNVPVR